NSLIAAVAPVGEPASGKRTRSGGAPVAFVLAMHPLLCAGRRVERDHRAAGAAGGVQHAADHERRALELELGPRAERIGLEAPGYFERAEVGGGDLGE